MSDVFSFENSLFLWTEAEDSGVEQGEEEKNRIVLAYSPKKDHIFHFQKPSIFRDVCILSCQEHEKQRR